MSQSIDMVLYCPNCGKQHIDAPDTLAQIKHAGSGTVVDEQWTNPPHKSHLCHGCGCVWRPADVPTNGVAELKTSGKGDTWPAGHNEEVTAMPAHGVKASDQQTFSNLVAQLEAAALVENIDGRWFTTRNAGEDVTDLLGPPKAQGFRPLDTVWISSIIDPFTARFRPGGRPGTKAQRRNHRPHTRRFAAFFGVQRPSSPARYPTTSGEIIGTLSELTGPKVPISQPRPCICRRSAATACKSLTTII